MLFIPSRASIFLPHLPASLSTPPASEPRASCGSLCVPDLRPRALIHAGSQMFTLKPAGALGDEAGDRHFYEEVQL